MNEDVLVYAASVRAEWIDYNGHMNDACYVRVFSDAIDATMDRIGLDAAARAREQITLYTLQTAVHYLKEIGQGEPFVVTARLLEYDGKKMRLFLTMRDRAGGAHALATMEALLLHVDMAARRSTPFRQATLDRLAELEARHRDAPWPAQAGAGIALKRQQ
ncbi:thioesterase family protein [Burkholderia sp. Ac-20379]|uniref:thioesterase family protein n=1 Tax=Burkholderia sp. Ac-20379 TaxID=2703900 RepID=UPI00197D1AFE|nr:thioesterase family protein [Burkholderia sp. Ac-20379]MBN3723272.1 thioesterase [Burkholderia sp. Ac-20379]